MENYCCIEGIQIFREHYLPETLYTQGYNDRLPSGAQHHLYIKHHIKGVFEIYLAFSLHPGESFDTFTVPSPVLQFTHTLTRKYHRLVCLLFAFTKHIYSGKNFQIVGDNKICLIIGDDVSILLPQILPHIYKSFERYEKILSSCLQK